MAVLRGLADSLFVLGVLLLSSSAAPKGAFAADDGGMEFGQPSSSAARAPECLARARRGRAAERGTPCSNSLLSLAEAEALGGNSSSSSNSSRHNYRFWYYLHGVAFGEDRPKIWLEFDTLELCTQKLLVVQGKQGGDNTAGKCEPFGGARPAARGVAEPCLTFWFQGVGAKKYESFKGQDAAQVQEVCRAWLLTHPRSERVATCMTCTTEQAAQAIRVSAAQEASDPPAADSEEKYRYKFKKTERSQPEWSAEMSEKDCTEELRARTNPLTGDLPESQVLTQCEKVQREAKASSPVVRYIYWYKDYSSDKNRQSIPFADRAQCEGALMLARRKASETSASCEEKVSNGGQASALESNLLGGKKLKIKIVKTKISSEPKLVLRKDQVTFLNDGKTKGQKTAGNTTAGKKTDGKRDVQKTKAVHRTGVQKATKARPQGQNHQKQDVSSEIKEAETSDLGDATGNLGTPPKLSKDPCRYP